MEEEMFYKKNRFCRNDNNVYNNDGFETIMELWILLNRGYFFFDRVFKFTQLYRATATTVAVRK